MRPLGWGGGPPIFTQGYSCLALLFTPVGLAVHWGLLPPVAARSNELLSMSRLWWPAVYPTLEEGRVSLPVSGGSALRGEYFLGAALAGGAATLTLPTCEGGVTSMTSGDAREDPSM